MRKVKVVQIEITNRWTKDEWAEWCVQGLLLNFESASINNAFFPLHSYIAAGHDRLAHSIGNIYRELDGPAFEKLKFRSGLVTAAERLVNHYANSSESEACVSIKAFAELVYIFQNIKEPDLVMDLVRLLQVILKREGFVQKNPELIEMLFHCSLTYLTALPASSGLATQLCALGEMKECPNKLAIPIWLTASQHEHKNWVAFLHALTDKIQCNLSEITSPRLDFIARRLVGTVPLKAIASHLFDIERDKWLLNALIENKNNKDKAPLFIKKSKPSSSLEEIQEIYFLCDKKNDKKIEIEVEINKKIYSDVLIFLQDAAREDNVILMRLDHHVNHAKLSNMQKEASRQ